MSRFTHLSTGRLNLDIILYVDRLPGVEDRVFGRDSFISIGGSATNYAIAVSKLGHNAVLAACTGVDPFSRVLVEMLASVGVDASRLCRSGGGPGTVVVLSLPDGKYAMASYTGANKALSIDYIVELVSYENPDIVHVAGLDPEFTASLIDRLSETHKQLIISYDPGRKAVDKPDKLTQIIPKINHLLLNEREFKALNLPLSKTLLRGRLEAIAIKMGGRGATLVTSRDIIRIEAYRPGKVVDTVGAGDVFDAAFNTYFLETNDYHEAVRAGVVAAGIKVTRHGSLGAPSRLEVDLILGKLRFTLKTEKIG